MAKMSKKSDPDTDLNLPERRMFVGSASIWKRIAAFVLDLLIIDVLLLGSYDTLLRNILKADTATSIFQKLQSDSSISTLITMLFFVITMIILAYFILFDYLIGQTPGKILLNIRVVSLSEDGFAEIAFWQAVIRSLFLIPTLPFIILWIADPAYLFFSKENQRLSELVCRTKVIETYMF